MRTQARRFGRSVLTAAGVLVALAGLAACGQRETFSDEFVCGDLENRDGSQDFVPSSCDADHTAERFFLFTAPFEDYSSEDIVQASINYCLPRLYARYDAGNDDGYGGSYTSVYDYDLVGVAPSVDEWNRGSREIACVAFRLDGKTFP